MMELYECVIKIQAKINASGSNNKRCDEYMRLFTAGKNYRLASEQLSEEQSLKRKRGFLLDKKNSLVEINEVIPEMESADAPEVFNEIKSELKAMSVIIEKELPETVAAILAVEGLLAAQNNGPSITKE